MGIAKGKTPPRYDKAFKEGAVKLVVEQGRESREVARELGICVDTLRNWLKASDFKPVSLERNNCQSHRLKELEVQNREMRKQLAEKEEVIAILKKSVGILSKP
jgi:transposase